MSSPQDTSNVVQRAPQSKAQISCPLHRMASSGYLPEILQGMSEHPQQVAPQCIAAETNNGAQAPARPPEQ